MRLLLTAALALGLAAPTMALDKVRFVTDWKAQAEHGGFYQAKAKGYYEEEGLDVEIIQGGASVNVPLLLGSEQAEFGIGSNSFIPLNMVAEGVPAVAVAAIFQKDPQVLISHPGQGNDTLAALKDKPILIAAQARVGFWPFLKLKFGYRDEQIRPYTFNMAPFLADKKLTQQGFLSSEPFVIRKAGVEPVVHLLADAGFENYNTTITISRKMVQEKKEIVQRFVDATAEGWAEYMKGGPNIAAANARILKDNPDMDQEKIDYALKVMNENGIVASGDAKTLGIGAMTDARWASFYKTMSEAGVVPAGVDVKKAYSLDFVNKGIGKG